MSMFGQLRNDSFKYRKRKKRSLDGSIPGAEYNHFRQPTTRPLGSAYRSGAYHQKLYLGDLPSEYHPHITAPAVQGRDYEPMRTWDFPVNSTTSAIRGPPSLDLSEMPPHLFPIVEDDWTFEERFFTSAGVSSRPQEGPVPIELDEIRHLLDGVRDAIDGDEPGEVDTVPRIADITDALGVLENVLPEDHPDIVNLKTALQIIEGQGFETSAADEPQSADDILEQDPVAQAQQVFDEQMQEFAQGFELPDFMAPTVDAFDAQQHALDQMLQAAEPDMAFTEADTLEQTVGQMDLYDSPEQEFLEPEIMPQGEPADMDMGPVPAMDGYAFDTAYDEIEQAIDHVSGHSMSENPMLEQPADQTLEPEDPWQMQQYMYDPYMQQLMNPYMMPGPMGPMPGPGM